MLSYDEADVKVAEEIEYARQDAAKMGMTNRADQNAFVIGWLSGCLRTCMLELAYEREQKMPSVWKKR